jgi:branched-chain amino acid transport system permease protein
VIVILALGAILPFALTSAFHVRLAMLVWIYAILGMSFNLLYGYSGQISLGQQTFFAIGGYAFAMLQVKLGWPAAFALLGSLACCALVAVVIGIPLLRLRTHYLAMATLAFALIVYGITIRWIDFTGGSSGLAVPQLTFWGTPLTRTGLYYAVLVVAGITLLLHDFIARSHLGRALQAIRDDELAAAANGVHVWRVKLRMFVLAAVIAALAGVCFSVVSLRVDPSMSEFHILVLIFTIAVVGGLGTRFGPVLGSIFVIVVPQILVSFGELDTLIYGVCILLFLLFLPHGVSGQLEAFAKRRAMRSVEAPTAEQNPHRATP